VHSRLIFSVFNADLLNHSKPLLASLQKSGRIYPVSSVNVQSLQTVA